MRTKAKSGGHQFDLLEQVDKPVREDLADAVRTMLHKAHYLCAANTLKQGAQGGDWWSIYRGSGPAILTRFQFKHVPFDKGTVREIKGFQAYRIEEYPADPAAFLAAIAMDIGLPIPAEDDIHLGRARLFMSQPINK